MKEVIIVLMVVGFIFFVFHKISNFKKSYSIKNIFKISCLKKIKKYE